MDPVSLVLAASSSKLVLEALKSLSKRILSEARPQPVTVRIGTSEVKLYPGEASPEDIQQLTNLLKSGSTSADVFALSREATNDDQRPVPPSPERTLLGAAALAISPEAVFSDARRRMNLVFKLNLAVAIALSVILFGGLSGAVYSSIFLKNNVWATAFGGVSAADILGLYIFKPLTAMNSALIATQRLEMLQLRLRQQLEECAQYSALKEKIECQTIIWNKIQEELATLAGSSTK